jgi:hypothetical protein
MKESNAHYFRLVQIPLKITLKIATFAVQLYAVFTTIPCRVLAIHSIMAFFYGVYSWHNSFQHKRLIKINFLASDLDLYQVPNSGYRSWSDQKGPDPQHYYQLSLFFVKKKFAFVNFPFFRKKWTAVL